MLDSFGVDRYRTIRLVGRGGMGEVYEVWDTRLERRVAVKRLHPHLVQRLDGEALVLSEARAAAKIEHANVVRVYGVEQAGQELLIEMQFIEGHPLNSLFASGPLAGPLAADLLRQILEGLRACHERGVTHCDLKPANMLVHASGAVYLTDFGIARALRNPLNLTGREAEDVPTWGTPRYSPPEALRGLPPTPKWDLYATGVVLFEALTGAAVFDGNTLTNVRDNVFTGPDECLARLRPDLSPDLVALVEDLMALDPADRPDNAKVALQRLRQTPEYEASTEETKPHPKTDPLPRLRRRPRRSGWAIAALVAPVVLAGSLWFSFSLWTAPTVAPGPIRAEAKPDIVEPRWPAFHAKLCAFAWDDGVHGEEPWGFFPGQYPAMLADLNPGPASSHPHHFIGVPAGTFLFVATTPEHGEELWRCQGWTESGISKPELVRDILPGPMSSAPLPLHAEQKRLLFLATTLNEGRELWCTTGEPAQTGMVSDLNTGVSDGAFFQSRFFPDETGAFWVAQSPAADFYGLCRYDFKTNQVSTLGKVRFDADWVVSLNGRPFFPNGYADQDQIELWSYNYQTRSTELFKALKPGSAHGSHPT